MKYTDFPLNVAFDLEIKTNQKLNIQMSGSKLISRDDEISQPEYHKVRFEGLVGVFENKVNSIIKLREKFQKQLRLLEKGEPIDVIEWKIVDIDDHLRGSN